MLLNAAVAQKYKVDMNINVTSATNGLACDCGNFYKIYAYFSDGSSREIQESLVQPNTCPPVSFQETFDYSNGVHLDKIGITAQSFKWGGSLNGCEQTFDGNAWITLPAASGCFSNYYTTYSDSSFQPVGIFLAWVTVNNYIIPGYNSSLQLNIYPEDLVINSPGTQNLLPTSDKITLTATAGFAATNYVWQYSPDGTNWTNFPAALQGTNTVTFSGQDLYGSSFGTSSFPNDTYIRIDYGCSPTNTYSTVTLQNALSSPHILSITPIPNTCYGDQTAGMIIQFDRALLPQEELDILGAGPVLTQVQLASNNSYTISGGLSSGTYTISLLGKDPYGRPSYTDAPNQTATVTITPPSAVAFTTNKLNDIHCFGSADGALQVNASGGVGGYEIGVLPPGGSSYNWMPSGAGGQTTVNSLSPGDVSIRVKDANGCTSKDGSGNEIIATQTMTQPAAPLTLDYSNVINPLGFGLADGSVTAVLKGGTPTASGAYTIDWTDSLGDAVSTVTNSSVGSTYQTVLQDGANGTYTLLATDANYALAAAGQQAGCMFQQTFTLIEPPPLVVTVTQTNIVTCYNASTAGLVAHAQGGMPIPLTDYNYQWYSVNGGTSTAIGTNDSVLSLLKAGNYQVLITDKNNITKLSSVFTIGQPAPLAIAIATTPLACNSDTNSVATATVTGGTQPYAYQWSTGATSAVIGGLSAGGYFLFVSDSNGCQAQQTASVTSPTGLVVDSVVTNPSCSGRCDGSVVLNVSGGAGGYTYTWASGIGSGPGTGSGGSTPGNSGPAPAGPGSSSLTGLCTGNYAVSISDQNGCTVTQNYQLVNPPSVAVNAGQNTTLCTGQVYNANAAIADSNAQYAWTGPNGFSATTPAVTLTNPGMYWVRVTNGTGCSGVDSFTLSQIDKTISADFVVSTQAFAGQPVTLINIASPDPDSISWQLPAGPGISVLGSDSVSLTIQFADTGTYTIGMKSWLTPCWAVSSQEILVLAPQVFNNPGSINDPLVATFTVSPNPSSGSFTAQITLNSVANIRLRLFSTTSASVFDDRQLTGLSTYTVSYSMGNLAKGSYFLLLETPAGSTIYEIVII